MILTKQVDKSGITSKELRGRRHCFKKRIFVLIECHSICIFYIRFYPVTFDTTPEEILCCKKYNSIVLSERGVKFPIYIMKNDINGNKLMIKRDKNYEIIKKSIMTRPITLITGARQAGKTTLAIKFARENIFEYISLDYSRN